MLCLKKERYRLSMVKERDKSVKYDWRQRKLNGLRLIIEVSELWLKIESLCFSS